MSTKPPSSEKDAPEDFWDLGDDDLGTDRPAPEEENVPQAPVEPTKSVSAPEMQPAPVPQDSVASEPVDPAKHAPSDESIEEPTRSTRSFGKWLKDLSIIEIASLLILIACLAGAAVWGFSTFHKEAPQGELVTFNEDFPVKGKNISAAEVETWWRDPIRTGDNPDRGVILDANLIPCARIKLQDSGSATLQVTFRDGKRNLVGDPITLAVEGGKFVTTGSDKITINSTSGFSSTSDLNAYTVGDIDPWSVVVEENNDNSDGEEPFLKVRIDSTYKED
ncbi:hypothetical protein V2O64_09380 [Verrucomicrobiaceae bacterium 227]